MTALEVLGLITAPAPADEHLHALVTEGFTAVGAVRGPCAAFVARDNRTPPSSVRRATINEPALLTLLRDAAASASVTLDCADLALRADDSDAPFARFYLQGEDEPVTVDREAFARVIASARMWGASSARFAAVRGDLRDPDAPGRTLVMLSPHGWCGMVVACEGSDAHGAAVHVANAGWLL